MKRVAVIIFVVIMILGALWIFIDFSGISDSVNRETAKTIPDSVLFNSAPVLSPQQALQTFEIQEGFKIELVASEPLIQNPVAMTFDEKGRMWVVEMQSFMPDVDGRGEEQANSRIVILEDSDGDGLMDESKVFLEGLVMPRAIAIVKNGILYAETPNLWFVENIDDRPGDRQLVDSTYAVGGNVEHQANGLLRGIDNWYYNAKSRKRYKLQDDQWLVEETEFRGQWGITKDNRGRLFYNTNSNQLRGDLVPPNFLNRNADYSSALGTNVEISVSQKVFPIRPTPGINRGYQEHMLDEAQRLTRFTAACGPLIYRGDGFSESVIGNAFVCEPAGNLVKRNILEENGFDIKARDAYEKEEFLASKDERFRPVNLYDGPDGAIYLLDMYNGIIQHKTYLTDYLKEQIKSRNLEKPLGLGRIYRIVPDDKQTRKNSENKELKGLHLDQAADETLVEYLSHPNGWWRDTAQRLLVERNNKKIVPNIVALLEEKYKNYNHLHALWTLEGLGVFDPEVIQLGMRSNFPEVVAAAVQIAANNNTGQAANDVLNLYDELIFHESPVVQLQIALSLGEFMDVDSKRVMEMLKTIMREHQEEALFSGAVISSIPGKEQQFLSWLQQTEEDNSQMGTLLEEIIDQRRIKNQLKETNLSESEKEQYILGKSLYERSCAACHGEDGEGVLPIAPPLAESEWVMGQEERLILVALHGLQGPITVKGKVYQIPEVQPVMPGLKNNPELSDENLARLLTYIRNAWGNKAPAISSKTVSRIREESKSRETPYTEGELSDH